jgi:hypothetical protein
MPVHVLLNCFNGLASTGDLVPGDRKFLDGGYDFPARERLDRGPRIANFRCLEAPNRSTHVL